MILRCFEIHDNSYAKGPNITPRDRSYELAQPGYPTGLRWRYLIIIWDFSARFVYVMYSRDTMFYCLKKTSRNEMQ